MNQKEEKKVEAKGPTAKAVGVSKPKAPAGKEAAPGAGKKEAATKEPAPAGKDQAKKEPVKVERPKTGQTAPKHL